MMEQIEKLINDGNKYCKNLESAEDIGISNDYLMDNEVSLKQWTTTCKTVLSSKVYENSHHFDEFEKISLNILDSFKIKSIIGILQSFQSDYKNDILIKEEKKMGKSTTNITATNVQVGNSNIINNDVTPDEFIKILETLTTKTPSEQNSIIEKLGNVIGSVTGISEIVNALKEIM